MNLASKNNWKIFLCPFVLLLLIYTIWIVRYPVWQLFDFVEPVFLILILSYISVLFLSILFLKKDAKKPLSRVFRMHGYTTPFIGLGYSFFFQTIWFSVYLLTGSKLEFLSFPSLKGYSDYTFYSVFSAFGFYLLFAVFGAFVEEVTFRCYIQSRIATKLSSALSIFTASLFFSLQHIHIFDLTWIERFFQMQFIYVFCFGVFVGYLFLKSGEDLWSVFAFHASMNIFNVTLPYNVLPDSMINSQGTTIITFVLMVFLLHLQFRKRVTESKGQSPLPKSLELCSSYPFS